MWNVYGRASVCVCETSYVLATSSLALSNLLHFPDPLRPYCAEEATATQTASVFPYFRGDITEYGNSTSANGSRDHRGPVSFFEETFRPDSSNTRSSIVTKLARSTVRHDFIFRSTLRRAIFNFQPPRGYNGHVYACIRAEREIEKERE